MRLQTGDAAMLPSSLCLLQGAHLGRKRFPAAHVPLGYNLVRKAGHVLEPFPSFTKFWNPESVSNDQPKVTSVLLDGCYKLVGFYNSQRAHSLQSFVLIQTLVPRLLFGLWHLRFVLESLRHDPRSQPERPGFLHTKVF